MSIFDNADLFKEKIQTYATNFSSDPGVVPPWVGEFWNEKIASEIIERRSDGLYEDRENAIHKTIIIARVHSLPRQDVIRKACEFRPDAKELLETWKSVWDRSFPGWEDDDYWRTFRSEEPRRHYGLKALESFLGENRNKFSKIAGGHLSNKAEFFLGLEEKTDRIVDDYRDYRLHIIDDANSIVSLKESRSNGGYVSANGIHLQVIGHFPDGLPKLKVCEESNNFIRRRMEDHPRYWQWSEFQIHMKRLSITTNNIDTMGALFADMAWQGHRHAFVKACSSKSGTWTVNLEGIKTIRDGVKRVASILPKKEFLKSTGYREYFMVQEHLPFSHEQRFFIVDGQIAASACSDRNFCVLDNRTGRRLDERIAVLDIPSIDQGEFDRGKTHHITDRAMAAEFAKFARQVVSDLKKAGHRDYVLDVGLTKRGVAAVEINTLHFAGPYCLDRKLLNQAYERRYSRFLGDLKNALLREIETEELSDDLKKDLFGLMTHETIEQSVQILQVQNMESEDIDGFANRIFARLLCKVLALHAGNKMLAAA